VGLGSATAGLCIGHFSPHMERIAAAPNGQAELDTRSWPMVRRNGWVTHGIILCTYGNKVNGALGRIQGGER